MADWGIQVFFFSFYTFAPTQQSRRPCCPFSISITLEQSTLTRDEVPCSLTILLPIEKKQQSKVKQRNMSHSPATPDKAGSHGNGSVSNAPLPSTDKLTSISKAKQASLNEPSPASTYGDTIAGGSSPATPLAVGSHGKCMYPFPAWRSLRRVFCQASWLTVLVEHDECISRSEARELAFRSLLLTHTPVLMARLMGPGHHMAGLIHSLQAAQIDPAIEAISGSPVTARDGKYLPQVERRVDRSIFTEAQLSPSKTGNLNHNMSTISSPSTDRVKDIRESPNWRKKDGNFVRRSGNHGEDPFLSNINAGQSQGQGKSSLSQINPALLLFKATIHPSALVGIEQGSHSPMTTLKPCCHQELVSSSQSKFRFTRMMILY